MDKKLHYHYVAIHVAYWASTVGSVGFAVPVLQKQGFNVMTIGILLTVRAVFSVFFQPIFANLFDRFSQRISLNELIATMIAVSLFITAWQMTNSNFTGMLLLFILYGTFTFGMSSFIDSLSSLYFHQGKKVHYPIARYTGSFSYAVFALFIGYVTSATIILMTQFFFLILLLVLVLKIDKVYGIVDIQPVQDKHNQSFMALLKKNPLFFFFLLATCFSFVGKEMSANFLVDVYSSVGGSGRDYGFGISLMSFAEVPMIFLFGRLLNRFGIEKLMVVSFFCAAVRILIIMVASNTLWLNFAQLFQLFGTGLFWAGNVQFVRTILPPNAIVRAQSAIGICYLGIGSGLGSLLSGMILEYTSLKLLLLTSFCFSFIGAIFMFIGNRRFTKREDHMLIIEISNDI